MRKIIIYSCLSVLLYGTANLHAQTSGIHFEPGLGLQQALEKAKAENKFVFVDCFATWCGPCKQMDKTVYPDSSLGQAINPRFISVKLQLDTSKNDDASVKANYQEAHDLMYSARIGAMPTFLFYSPDGQLVQRGLGYHDNAAMQELFNSALDPSRQFYTQSALFSQGKLAPAQVAAFADMAAETGEQKLSKQAADNYISAYLMQQTHDSLFKKERLGFIKKYTLTVNDTGFAFLQKNSEAVNHVLGPYTAERKIITVIADEQLAEIQRDGAHPDWMAIRAVTEKKFGKKWGGFAVNEEKCIYTFTNKDYTGLGEAYTDFFKTLDTASYKTLNRLSVNILSYRLFQGTITRQYWLLQRRRWRSLWTAMLPMKSIPMPTSCIKPAEKMTPCATKRSH